MCLESSQRFFEIKTKYDARDVSDQLVRICGRGRYLPSTAKAPRLRSVRLVKHQGKAEASLTRRPF